MPTLDTVKEAIETLFPLYSGEVSEGTTAADVPGWDSVAHVQLIFLLEEISGKSIDLAKSVEVQSVGDLVKLIDMSPS
jgi:acyl carrier protein